MQYNILISCIEVLQLLEYSPPSPTQQQDVAAFQASREDNFQAQVNPSSSSALELRRVISSVGYLYIKID